MIYIRRKSVTRSKGGFDLEVSKKDKSRPIVINDLFNVKYDWFTPGP